LTICFVNVRLIDIGFDIPVPRLLQSKRDRNPLVYPVFSGKGDRDVNDAFLPTTYRSNFLSKELCDQIRTYAYNCNRNISEQDAKKLNKYLQPIFYIAQLEVMKMLEGRESLYHSPRWVYAKDRDGIVQSVKKQYPEREDAIQRLVDFAHIYAITHMIPEDVLNVFYRGNVNLHALLQDLKVKSARHEAMVADLYPARLRGDMETIRNNLLESLVLHDMVDRFKLFYPYDVHRLG
jgi:hypothetical protein